MALRERGESGACCYAGCGDAFVRDPFVRDPFVRDAFVRRDGWRWFPAALSGERRGAGL
jgi:hypothetical protein